MLNASAVRSFSVPAELLYRAVAADEILELRRLVLIPGTTRTSAAFEGDEDAGTSHFGAFHPRNAARCVACVSYMRADVEGEPAYQLRGMAVAPDLQKRGVGSVLLELAEGQMCVRWQARVFWCNARTPAVRFYERHGWQAVGEIFEIDGVGPHRRMIKRLVSRGASTARRELP